VPVAAAFLFLTIHGFVDGYYAWSTSEHDNFVPGTGTTAKRANALDLNLMAIDVVHDAKPVGFHVALVAGGGADVVHANEPRRYRHIYQASILYKASDRLSFEAGIFPSHIGFEGFYSKDNWNYTRGWLGEFSPYYQAGIHANYRFNDHWSGELHVLNGWQLIADNNDAKAIGAKIAYSNNRLSASFNTFDGPELPHDNTHWRHFGDLIATYKATQSLSVGGSLDRGRQELPRSAAANWLGIAAYGRYVVDSRQAVAVRVERFNDPDNGISGTSQKLTEGTLTYEVRPAGSLILKVEARRDHSTAPVFGASRNETIVVIGAVAKF
jgi:Putative beta-barrel porin-2, OmpL-like. bbp2